jgi:ankyrin repeat protein
MLEPWQYGWGSSLRYAAAWRRLSSAKILLDGGADPNVRNKKRDAPLEDAFALGHQEIWLFMKEAALLTPELWQSVLCARSI